MKTKNAKNLNTSTNSFWEVVRNQKRLLVALIIIVFGISVRNGYSLDDEIVTTEKNSKVLKGFGGIYEILTTPYSSAFDGKAQFEYRPVTQITFAIEKGIFGFKPQVSHLINLLLYIFLCLLIFRLLRVLMGDQYPFLPLLVMVVFALHPLHTEVVFSLKNREELLVSIFGFLSLDFTLKYLENRSLKTILLVILCVILGYNTKSTFTPFIYLIPVVLWYLGKLSGKQAVMAFLAFAVVSALSVYIPRMLMQQSLSRDLLMLENPMYEMGLFDRLPMSFAIFARYIALHLWPFPLVSYYGYAYIEISTWKSVETWFGLGLLATTLYLLWRWWKKDRTLTLGLILFLGFMAPYQNFPFPVSGIVAERFSFNSILGFALLFCYFIFWLIKNFSKFSVSVRYTFLVIMLVFGIKDIMRASDWNTFFSLMEKDVQKAPQSAKLNIMYAELLLSGEGKPINENEKQEQLKLAESAFRRAEQKIPGYPGLESNLGVCLFMQGRYREALGYLHRGVEAGSTNYQNLFNLGACYELLNDTSNAIIYYKKAAQGPNPEQANARLFLLK